MTPQGKNQRSELRPRGSQHEVTRDPGARSPAVEAARRLVTRGFAVVPVPRRSKKPRRTGWPDLRIEESQLPEYFRDPEGNIGILMGEPSGGVVDIDLDHPLAVELAPQYLPPTGAVFGRASKRQSHWLYRVKGAIETRKFKLPSAPGQKSGEMVVELRSTGCQTLAPGSVHPSGEHVEWHADGEPAEVDGQVLLAAIAALYREVLRKLGRTAVHTSKNRTTVEPLIEVLSRLKGVAASSNGHTACCPAHDDQNPSLSVSAGADGRVLLHCHAGCTAESVVAALGLTMADLFPRRSRSKAKQNARHNPDGESKHSKESFAQRLVACARGTPGIEFFRSGDDLLVTLPAGDHIETGPLAGPQFRHWLAARAYTEGGLVPNTQSLTSAIETLSGCARFGTAEHPTGVRLAQVGKTIYLDLGDEHWRVARVNESGWSVIEAAECPVRFTRRPGMLALPVPERGGSLEELRPLLNLRDDDQWWLVVGWLISAFRPEGPYAALVVCGEAGSCKSTLCKVLRRLIDPNDAGERRLPREERELFIAARNGWVVSYNNIDTLPPHFSDGLCSILTEGAHAVRVNFADTSEVLFRERRPMILNGISCAAVRPDLMDRSVVIGLDRLPDDRRRDEQEVLNKFERIRPRVQGAILDAVSCALRRVDSVRLMCRPRIADVATWVTAASEALGWPEDRFVGAVQRNRAEAHAEVVEGSFLASAITDLADRGDWEGTAKDLIRTLQQGMSGIAPRDLPRDPGALTRELRALVISLRATGVEVQMPSGPTGNRKRRIIRIRRVAAVPGEASPGGADAARAAPAARVCTPNNDMARTAPNTAHGEEPDQPEQGA